jgi:SWI/SNF-related matrix-associated actin-dependent regulator of chromatin subfamily A member 5
VLRFHGTQEEREQIKKEELIAGNFEVFLLRFSWKELASVTLPREQVVITTYEMAIRERAALKRFSFQYLIIDEAHRIKNEKSVLAQVVRIYSSQFRLLLTGTPLQVPLTFCCVSLSFLSLSDSCLLSITFLIFPLFVFSSWFSYIFLFIFLSLSYSLL